MTKETSKSTTVLIVVAVIGVIGTIAGSIVKVVGDNNIEKLRQSFALTQMALEFIATQGEATQMVLETTANAPTPLPYPTYTAQPVVVITATSAHATDTPEPITVQAPGFVFEDDFEDGPDPGWKIQYGEPGMANGKYTVVAPFVENVKTNHFALLDEYNWGNATIEFEVSEYDSFASNRDGYGALILHYDHNKGGVGFIIHPHVQGVQFGTLNPNKEWTYIPGSLVGGQDYAGDFQLYSRGYRFRVEVTGDTYIAYVEDRMVTSATIPGYQYGKIGFWFLTGDMRADPEYYAPRFEYITVESKN